MMAFIDLLRALRVVLRVLRDRPATFFAPFFATSLASLLVSYAAYSQNPLSDRLLPSDDLDLPYEDLYETLSQLTSHPLNLNRATRDELLSPGILSQSQADNLIAHRQANGDLLEIYELQSIPSFDLETIHNILPFVTIGSRNNIHSQYGGYFFTRYERTLEQSRGFSSEADSSSKYNGDPGRIYSRIRVTNPGRLSFGMTAEKDAGEQFAWTKQQRGFDFYSAHLQLTNNGPLANVILGDFVAQFGQGLTVGGGFGAGKGSETITTLRRISTGFMPYSSANEFGFFRGVAATARLPANILLHTFVSSLPRDASSSSETSLSVLQSGKHRTASEIDGRHQLSEKNFGAALEYKGRSFEAGAVAHRTMYGQPLNKSPAIYNGFDFNGAMNSNLGVFGAYTVSNFSLFAEYAQTIGHGSAWVAGVLGSITRTIDVSLLARSFDTDYFTSYSNAISENTAPRNERGIYWGWKHAISRKVFYTAYTDLFTFPWLKFRSYVPSSGAESLVRLTYRLSKTIEFYVQFRDERKVHNVPAGDNDSPVYKTRPGLKRNWILNSSVTVGDLALRTRIQYSSYRQLSASHGFAMAFDASYDWSKVSIDTRVAIFDTDDFDNRQYMNERDVLMAFSFPAMYGEGTRTYVVARLKLLKWLDLSMKAARTSYFTSVSSGSGGDTIDGNTRHDVKVQAVFRL
ncbi:MAG TPA: helix-hairpin-helix domain-containing protein [Cyclobacteriaceae bacterium]|nr:helix-hairpin-helix domain-containing protein [Cyclobacteriaceae bacterium]